MRNAMYSQLRMLNRVLTSRRIADELGPFDYKESIFRNIENMFLDSESLTDILRMT